MKDKVEIPEPHIYENWKAVTESDFVTLFIKTWFAFVATLRELYPDSIKPYYQASGDAPCLSAYKRRFSEDFYFLCNYSQIETSVHSVYRKGLTITCEKYPRFLIPDFFSMNNAFKESYGEEFSSKGGYAGKLRLVVKNKSDGIVRVELTCTDKLFQEKAHCNAVLLSFDEDYSSITSGIVQHLENTHKALTDTQITKLFYSMLFDKITYNLVEQLEEKKSVFPRKGNVNLIDTFELIQAFCLRASDSIRQNCLNASIKADHKLLYQEPIAGFIQNDTTMTAVEEQKALLWFIGYVYRLRNALFHEIIDPLDSEWQYVFKNAYLALKQIVDTNITRLQWIKAIAELAPYIFQKDFNEAPPFGITSADYEKHAKMTITDKALSYYNINGAKVHLKATLDYKEQHYLVEGDVVWNERMEKHTVKHVSIVESAKD